MSLNMAYFVKRTAEQYPERTAVCSELGNMTYAELQLGIEKVATILRRYGIGRGDKVAIMLPNVAQFPMVYYGILMSGAAVIPVNCQLTSFEIKHYLENSDAQIFFVWRAYAAEAVKAYNGADACDALVWVGPSPGDEYLNIGDSLEEMMESAAPCKDMAATMPDETAVIIHTSGTTGRPKGAELTHFNLFSNAYTVKEQVMKPTGEDMVMVILPLFHAFGQTCLQNAVLMGGATMLMMQSFNIETALRMMKMHGVTIFAAVPTIYFYMLQMPDAIRPCLESIRMAISGGAPLPAEVAEQFEAKFGKRVHEGYGLSETSPVASINMPDDSWRPGSIGQPVWGCEMMVTRFDGTEANTDEVGEILIRGLNVMKGYYKDEVATAETIQNGWLHTGDLGRKDKDGCYFIVGRKKDIIIRSGINVYPREVEDVLHGHPAVREAAVIGVPDLARGEEVQAYVALRMGIQANVELLGEYCRERLARHKCPKEIIILPELPKGPTGKILKDELRRMQTQNLGTFA
jgi:long-chain acyl-CoA synthetase